MPQTFRRWFPPVVLLALASTLLPLLGGCAFDRNWKHLASAAPSTGPASADQLAGRWEGTWKSDQNGHSGKLRAIIVPAEGNDAAYRADFDATYFGLLRFGYSMGLAAQQHGDGIEFQGEENLGWLAGGMYRYKGTTDGQSFDCTYESSSDRGRFQMTRPAP